MQTLSVVLNFLILLALGSVALFLKHYLPSYMDEKGNNLATKEDIEEITAKTEEVQRQFKEQFELFSTDVRFKYDHFYRQYSGLYYKIYSIIMQSEYVRHYIYLYSGKTISFDEAPFVEVSPTKRVTDKIEFKAGQSPSLSHEESKKVTPISEFNKKQMCDYIISNGEYASQHLLKLAVSYRFAHSNYAGNPAVNNVPTEVAYEEEIRLIRELVCCIVKEYNILRRELKMEYIESELTTGIPEL